MEEVEEIEERRGGEEEERRGGGEILIRQPQVEKHQTSVDITCMRGIPHRGSG
jgi:hypothetical protein